MSGTVTANNGVQLPTENLAKIITYTGDLPTAITIEFADNTYVKTLGYNGDGLLISVSQWEVQ